MLLSYALVHIATVIGFFLPVSIADLAGIISQSIESPELIRVVITNQGSRHVALLKHNTVFDTSHLSMPCIVTDGNGKRVPMIASHAVYSGISKDDFLDLAPGSNFTRVINMTEYLVDDGSAHAQSSKPITISLSPTAQGRNDRGGYHKIHPNPLGHISGSRARVADVSTANLSYIPLRSNPLQVTVANRYSPAVLEKRQNPPFNGMKVAMNDRDCPPAQSQNFSNAILQSRYLAIAAQNAATNFTKLPFNYFMPATIEASNKVGQAMSKIAKVALGQGPPVVGTCIDSLKNCDSGSLLGYAMMIPGGHSNWIPRVVLCPAALALPDITLPCQGPPGQMTTAYVLLHELAHIDEISGIRAEDWPRPKDRQSARNVHKDVLAGKDTTMDAVALGLLGSWSWDLGLGTGKPCLQKFYEGNFDSLQLINGKMYSG